MSDENTRALETLLRALDDFVRGSLSIEDLQWYLESTSSLLDRRFADVSRELNAAEFDLESIRFTVLRDEQMPAAIFRVDPVRELVARRLAEIDE